MLYKYVGNIDDDKVIEYLDAFVNKGTIYASRTLDFNDPAELKLIFNFDAEFEIIKKRFHLDCPRRTEYDFRKWYERFDKNSKWLIKYNMREHTLTTKGIVCLTRDYDNYLMWSHYANSHTGFCIGFDSVFTHSIEDRGLEGEVVYVDTYPRFNYYTDSSQEYLNCTYLHKGMPWAYENEYRVITEGCGIKRFDKSLIKEITLGCRASFKLQDYASKLIDKGIDVYKMALDRDSYRLKRVPVKKGEYFQGDT
ncbi:DUF2971 domain-containing protein [Rosenbergiella nectarea]|uniref:DUF2971 domain-containing protein n=1 Tax=Rosenbergiella nectarea TaxID=988801 RepID=UPI001BDA2123|nr:DUF2971 domain-containing protein [Rosenbergiella nectarea]MBT0729234.1 DUF2971 domain-containing protein [Rosenbergiella nectarea subsp. apis]